MERNIENWIKIISKAQRVDITENYEGVYDAHLKAQAVVGPDIVNFLSDEEVASQTARHIHNRRKSSSTMRLLLPTDENITSDSGDDGEGDDTKA